VRRPGLDRLTGRGRAGGAGTEASRLTSVLTVTSPAGRLTAALELLGEAFSVRLLKQEDDADVPLFPAEAVCCPTSPE
jgi:hypothetical protein